MFSPPTVLNFKKVVLGVFGTEIGAWFIVGAVESEIRFHIKLPYQRERERVLALGPYANEWREKEEEDEGAWICPVS